MAANETGETRTRARLFAAITFLIFTGAYSACFYFGFVQERSGSWPRFLLVVIAGGLGLMAGEFLFERIGSVDRVTDPLWRRALHLALLLLALVGFIIVTWALGQFA